MPLDPSILASQNSITLRGVKTNNLKDIDIELPKNTLITMTGVSGSGKSSLAFHTIYKEGQFRYIESLSSYLRQFFNLGSRPELEYSSGLSPAVAIEQNKRLGNSRSTVGTLTELDDYLRLMLAKLGKVFCYECGDPLRPKTTDQIVDDIFQKFTGEKVYLLQDFGTIDDVKSLGQFVRRNRRQVDQGGGCTRMLVGDQECFYLEDPVVDEGQFPVKVYGVFDRVTVGQAVHRRLKDDVIKMLARVDKFGVKSLEGGIESKGKESESKQIGAGQRVILMHGKDAKPDDKRYPRFGKEAENLGFEYIAPDLPYKKKPRIDAWMKRLTDLKPDKNTTLIGHSRGGMAVIRWLENAPSPVKVNKVILIATNWGTDPDTAGGDFFGEEYDFEKIKKHCDEFVVRHSEDDKWVPFESGTMIADGLGCRSWFPKEMQHFGKNLDGQLPELVDELIYGYNERKIGKGSSTSDTVRYTDKFYCAKDDIKYPELTPAHFSANRQEGACEECHGLGEVMQVDVDKVLDPTSRYMEAILPRRDSQLGQAILRKLAYAYQIKDTDVRADLPDRFTEAVIQGDNENYKLSLGGGKYITMRYKGLQDVLIDQYQKGVLTVDYQAMLDMHACPSCHGAKLQRQALSTYITPERDDEGLKNINDIQKKYTIYDLQSMPISELSQVLSTYMKEVSSNMELAKRIVTPLLDRAQTITDLGLGYISSVRKIDTLSGGEIQRMRLAKQLGNKLTGIIYVLDEPTIGLDHGEILKVIEAIRGLQQMGNTIIVVEHNDEFIKASDRIVEIGPGAGDFGGHLVFNGQYADFLKQDSLTAQYIKGDKKVTASFDHTPSRAMVSIKKASKYNLKNIDVDIPLGSFTIITGPSGAGKTTLMYHTLFTFLEEKQKRVQSQIRLQLLKEGLSRQEIIQAPVMQRKRFEHLEQIALQQFYEHIGVETITGREEIDNVLYVDQTSIGKTPRSCPATFVGVFDDIRKMFAGVTESKMLGFNAGHFSFNSSKGACPGCKGYGHKKVELQFLPDAYVPCELCHGRRYKPEILDIKRHDKTISEILSMYVKDAYEFFEDIPFLQNKLELLMDIGLGYLKMGQPAHTLSGGESQRLKLVKHLLKQYRGHTVYFLDEPTVGLHPSDIEKLLKVLKRFLEYGDTVLMIEHERNLLQFADKVIRLDNGGLV